MAKGKCSRCKKILTRENSCASALSGKGSAWCRECVKDRAKDFTESKHLFSPYIENDGRCNEPVKTIGGGSRGFCVLPFGHAGRCGNHLCTFCGVNIRPSRHAWCRDCQEVARRRKGVDLPKRQIPGELWTFSCGCSGVLPLEGENNKLAFWSGSPKHGVFAHYCRAAKLIRSIGSDAKRRGYKPIDVNTPHSIIFDMMEEKNCYLCLQPLLWEFGLGKTPCLHHNHVTGEILGFSHSNCNLLEMVTEINSLREELLRLRKEVQERKTEVLSGNYSD